ncbi:MAG: aminopeptidase P family protein [Rhodospirillaceae bacterium]|nr:aminopeptidase P family protein [Rhodospirillaceae bacterium]
MDRRDLMTRTGIGIAAAAAAALSPNANAAGPAMAIPKVNPSGKLLVNKDRARQIMERYKIDGLIAATAVNVYYLSNLTPLNVRYRSELGGFATFPRDPDQPSFVLCGTSETFDIANRDREIPEQIFFTGIKPDAVVKPGIEPEASQPREYISSKNWQFTERETRWLAMQKQALATVAPGAGWAIARALKRSGLTKGRIAVDDMRIKYLLDEIGFEGVTIVPGDDLFKLIRMVKTPTEVEMMRIAGRSNGEAAMATMRRFEAGMTFDDFENMFRQESANRGNQMLSILCGIPGGMLPDGVAVKGRPYLIDAVSTFGEYNGDFGRTLVLGEPSKETLFRAKAMEIGRDTVFAMAKPGVKFSAVRQAGFDAMVKAGIPEKAVFVTPHCVGLVHSDQPFRLSGIDDTPFEHVLEENMVLTIDLPHLEIGYGGGHFEDLIRITKTGVEPFNELSGPLVVV